jgi:hypothetical protein
MVRRRSDVWGLWRKVTTAVYTQPSATTSSVDGGDGDLPKVYFQATALHGCSTTSEEFE